MGLPLTSWDIWNLPTRACSRDPLVMRQVREQALPLELTVEAHANTLCTAREIFSKDGR